MAHLNLPIDVLRTYLAVIDLSSFTKAGEVLGRTQPAISLQIRRLEELVGRSLMDTTGRNITLTKDGQNLARHARQLLAVNDEIVAHLQKRELDGVLRVGLPTDYAVSFFQKVLSNYLRTHPDVQMLIDCDISENLLKMLERDELDIVIAMYDEKPAIGLIYTWVERPIWAVGADTDVFERNPVPLVVHPEGCHYRDRIIKGLDQIQKPWRVSYCSPGISGLQEAVQSGLGVTALTKRTLMRGMRVLNEKDGFPPLPDIHVGLHFKNTSASTSALLMVNYIMKALHDSGQTDFMRLERMIAKS